MELPTEKYVMCQQDFLLTLDPVGGVAPVTISVPHDTLWRYELEGIVPERASGVRGRDRMVWAIVRDILLEAPVNVVRGLLPRAVCDYNRAEPPGVNYDRYVLDRVPDSAYDYEPVGHFWRAYHGAVRRRLLVARAAGLRPLLLDLHGFGRPAPYGDFDVILGTGNRTTVRTDVDLALGAWLRGAGYEVFVPALETVVPGAHDHMDAEYTTRATAEELRIDAVQVEIGRRFREVDAGPRGRLLARCLAGFVAEYSG